MEQEVKIPKKKNPKKRVILKILIAFIAICAAFGAAALVNYFISNKDIKVGDTNIKVEDINSNVSDMESFISSAENGASILQGKTVRDKVRDDLILNAGLKKSITDCKVDVDLSNGAIASQRGLSAGDFGSLKNYQKVMIENDYLKARLENCLIIRRSYFGVAKMYANLTESELNEAKAFLNNTVLPLFKGNNSDGEIANFIRSKYPDYLVFYAGQDANDDIDLVPDYLKAEALNSKSFDGLFTNVGDYTEAVVRQNGELGIYRMNASAGKYDSWDKYFDHLLKSVATNNSSLLALAFGNSASAATVTKQEYCYGNWGVPSYYAQANTNGQQFTSHVVKYHFIFVDSKTNARVPNVNVRIKQSSSPAVDKSYPFCIKDMNGNTDGSGIVDLWANCFTGPPVVDFDAGNKYKGGKYTYTTKGSRFDWTYYQGNRENWDSQNGLVTFPNNSIDSSGVGTISNGHNGADRVRFFPGINGANVELIVYLEQTVQPPADRHDSPRQSSSVKTQVRLNNTGNWQDGTIVAPVGSTVNFKHTVNGNFNSSWSDYFIDWQESNGQVSNRNVNRSGISLGSNASGDVVVQGDTTGLKNNVGVTPIEITHADVGKTICENMNYTWRLEYYYQKGNVRNGTQVHDRTRDASRDQRGSGSSSQACVYVPYNYELTPCINGSGSMCGGVDIPGEPGETIPNTPEVNNPNGNTPSRPDTRWIITTWTVSGNYENRKTPNSPISNSNGNTCSVYSTAYGAPLGNCRASETGTQSFPPNGKTGLGLREISIPENAPLGSRYCIALSVSPYKLEANESQAAQNQKVGTQWRHSAPFCLKATKKPKFQVWGNGIYSRGGIVTSRSNIKGGVFGSWVEYEAIAGGKVNGFTSESSNTGNRLTFANDKSGTKGNWGNWTGATETNRIISNIEGRYPSSRSGVVRETRNGIYGGHDGNTTPDTHTRIIDSEGMFLTGNITSRSPLGTDRIRAFQQTIIIVDGDLYISKDVTKIDAWLIVKGKIVTCATEQRENSAIVNNNNCGKTLQVNGPIIANNLKSWRTGGSEFSNPGSPSETYNQRADVYLWAYAQGTSSNKVVTTYTKEIPVRY